MSLFISFISLCLAWQSVLTIASLRWEAPCHATKVGFLSSLHGRQWWDPDMLGSCSPLQRAPIPENMENKVSWFHRAAVNKIPQTEWLEQKLIFSHFNQRARRVLSFWGLWGRMFHTFLLVCGLPSVCCPWLMTLFLRLRPPCVSICVQISRHWFSLHANYII